MRRSFLLILIVLTVALLAAGLLLFLQDVPPQLPDGEVARISAEDLYRQLQGSHPPLVWEFVSEEQFASGHVPGAQRLMLDDLPAATEGLSKTQAIVALCT